MSVALGSPSRDAIGVPSWGLWSVRRLDVDHVRHHAANRSPSQHQGASGVIDLSASLAHATGARVHEQEALRPRLHVSSTTDTSDGIPVSGHMVHPRTVRTPKTIGGFD